MSKSPNHNANSAGMLFLVELRIRLIYSLLLLLGLFAILLYFANPIYTWLATPLLKFLPHGQLIATQIVSPFFVPVKLAFMVAFLLGVPFFLYQVWAFVSPALYGHEKRLIWPFLLISILLFYGGIVFAYTVILPTLFHFLTGTAPQGVVLSPDMNEYFDFTIKLLLMFGCLFEIPILMLVLVACRIVERAWFVKMRAYAIVAAFIIGMLLAPPDVLSQTVLAFPVWLLYEAGIFLTRFLKTNVQYEK